MGSVESCWPQAAWRRAAAEMHRQQPTAAWAVSRRRRSRLRRSLRGNIRNVVANIGGLSNLGDAVRDGPDVALLQELWASAENIRAEAKKRGYVAAVADGPECLAAVLIRPGTAPCFPAALYFWIGFG